MKTIGKNKILSGWIACAIFLVLLALPQQAKASCNDCIVSYRACLQNSLTPGLPWVPFNWFAGGPARCVANRSSCLKGCGFNDCKKSCKENGKVEADFCKQQFAETKCGIKDRACKKKARKLKNQCIKDARSEKRSCVKECRDERKDPSRQGELQTSNFRVNVLGTEKSGMVRFQLIRNQKTANCNKIKMIRINGGQFPDYIMTTPLCSFTQELRVQIFRNLNCENSINQAVKFELYTVKHPSRTGPYQSWNNRGEQTVSVSSDLICKKLEIGSTRLPIKLPSRPCAIKGWWKMNEANGTSNGVWQFYVAKGARGNHYFTKGPATKDVWGKVKYQNGTGQADIGTNKSFKWDVKGSRCTGLIDDFCSKVTGTCVDRRKHKRNNFSLVKVSGPPDTPKPLPSPVGKPSSPNRTITPKPIPKHPWDNFTPPLPLPPKPHG